MICSRGPCGTMRMKFRIRIVVLLCFIAFSIWIILYFNSISSSCGSNGKPCFNKDKIVRNISKEDRYVHPNSELMIGKIKDKTDENIKDEGYSKYAFNDLISRRIGHHRAIPDTRHEM